MKAGFIDLGVMRTTMAWNQQLAVAMPKKAFLGDDSPDFACRLAGKDVRHACEVAEVQSFEALVGRAVVILEFPSMAQAWSDSPEYTTAKRLRQMSAKTNPVMIEGFVPS